MNGPALPFVSVIIPAFNNAEGLRRCLEALGDQTYPADRHEVLVVDNGSREDLRPVVAGLPRVRLLREDAPGSYAARNRGIAEAAGEALAFTDSDCVPARNWIERGAAHLLEAPACGFVAGRVDLAFRDPASPTPSELYDLVVMNFHQDRNVAKRRFGATANLFTFKRVFEAVGAFDGALMSGGDLEWGQRVYAHGLLQQYADDVHVTHPARYSLEETYRQAVRLAGGRYRLKLQEGATPASRAVDLLRAFTPAVGFYWRLLRDQRLPRGRDRLAVVRVAIGVKYVTAAELTRLMMGGAPRRG
jgi:glycosyltransferase involved in cell wall biosynthesis